MVNIGRRIKKAARLKRKTAGKSSKKRSASKSKSKRK